MHMAGQCWCFSGERIDATLMAPLIFGVYIYLYTYLSQWPHLSIKWILICIHIFLDPLSLKYIFIFIHIYCGGPTYLLENLLSLNRENSRQEVFYVLICIALHCNDDGDLSLLHSKTLLYFFLTVSTSNSGKSYQPFLMICNLFF